MGNTYDEPGPFDQVLSGVTSPIGFNGVERAEICDDLPPSTLPVVTQFGVFLTSTLVFEKNRTVWAAASDISSRAERRKDDREGFPPNIIGLARRDGPCARAAGGIRIGNYTR